MSHIRYKIHIISAQALIAYAKGYHAEPDRYHYHLNKRETESTIVRQGETYQEDNAIFFQAMCAVKGEDYRHSGRRVCSVPRGSVLTSETVKHSILHLNARQA